MTDKEVAGPIGHYLDKQPKKKSLKEFLEEAFKNQQHFSKRSDDERRALHSQFRQLNKTDDAAANSNPRPWTDEDYKNLEKWTKSREKDESFKSQVNDAKYKVALHKQRKDK